MGYNIYGRTRIYGRKNSLYQDNQSAMSMEKNSRNSCIGNSRHININYFFIKDCVDKGEFEIEYCWTGFMLVDFFMKPLHSQLFHIFRNVIMGYAHISTLKIKEFWIKQHVGKVIKIHSRILFWYILCVHILLRTKDGH